MLFAERQREGQKWKFSTASATTVESQVIRPSSVMQKGGKAKGKGKKGDNKGCGMTVQVGQPERDGQKVKVGTRQVKVGSNTGQLE